MESQLSYVHYVKHLTRVCYQFFPLKKPNIVIFDNVLLLALWTVFCFFEGVWIPWPLDNLQNTKQHVKLLTDSMLCGTVHNTSAIITIILLNNKLKTIAQPDILNIKPINSNV